MDFTSRSAWGWAAAVGLMVAAVVAVPLIAVSDDVAHELDASTVELVVACTVITVVVAGLGASIVLLVLARRAFVRARRAA